MRSAPQTTLVEFVIKNMLKICPTLNGCPIIISYDFNVEKYGELAHQYLENLIKLDHTYIGDNFIEVIYSVPARDWSTGQRQSFLNMTEKVSTKYLLHFEHDWVFNTCIGFNTVLQMMAKYDMQYLGFNKKHNIRRGCDYCLEAFKGNDGGDIPVLKSSRYSNNPHLATRGFWQERIKPLIINTSKVLYSHVIEKPVYEHYAKDIKTKGFEQAHKEWGIYVYGNLNDLPTIGHLDGKKWLPKK
jgi:hypothetical protein